jgi:hypothetical protein
MSSSAAHSLWSASGFERKILCPGSHVIASDVRDQTTYYAAEGTAAHQVLSWALQYKTPAAGFIGRYIDVEDQTIEVTAEMAEAVQVCLDYVTDVSGDMGVVLTEQRVNYSRSLGVPVSDAWGTADVIILLGDEIIVIDYKHGRGVEVEAHQNPQMSLYALGAIEGFSEYADFERVRMVISQPRARRAPSEWDTTPEALIAWADSVARAAIEDCAAAAVGRVEDYLRPGEKQCKFCRAKATCPALRDAVADTALGFTPASPEEFAVAGVSAADEHSPEDWLAAALSRVDLIEDWCKAIRTESERRLLAGMPVPGWKLVPGKRGARQWSSPQAAEELLRKTFRLTIEQAYDLKLISPTSAEKLKKSGVIGDRQWSRVQDLITQSDGKPHVAPASDPRPALEIVPVVAEFADLTLVA